MLVPLIIKLGIDGLNAGFTRHKLLDYAGLLLAVALVKAIFQFWMRWINSRGTIGFGR